jgi:uncharacterized protein YeaO (DUF488 family)
MRSIGAIIAFMAVRTKSIYDPAEPDDGTRILATNYWPRGVSKERAGTYMRILAPSRELLRAFKDGVIDWPAYEPRYIAEMRAPEKQATLDDVAAMAERGAITIMCICADESQCHRRLLRSIIEARIKAPA